MTSDSDEYSADPFAVDRLIEERYFPSVPHPLEQGPVDELRSTTIIWPGKP